MSPPSLDTPDYQIGPSDILNVTVYGHEDLTQTVIVQPDGTFAFPLIGRVKASDMSPGELERKLTTLLAQGYVRNPQVSVVVHEYRSKTVFVVGEVARPGSYPIGARMNVVEALARAGPLGPTAAVEILVVRPRAGASGPVLPAEIAREGEAKEDARKKEGDVFSVNLRTLQSGDLTQNIDLLPHDTVFVPRAPNVYVSGQVRTPGAYPYQPGMTVRQLISIAGGLTENGSDSRLKVVRESGGKAVEVKIRVDDAVQPGDTVVVRAKLF